MFLGGSGLLLLHVCVNTLNDYFDYESGIDLATRRTPFSGGSGILPAGALAPRAVYRFAIVCFALTVPIGIYLLLARGWLLAPLLAVGAVSVLFYTQHLARWGVGEVQAIKAIQGAWHHDDPARLIPGMRANVVGVLLTNILVAVGYVVAALLR